LSYDGAARYAPDVEKPGLNRRDFLRTLAYTPPILAAACADSSGPSRTAHLITARRTDPTVVTAPGKYALNLEPGLRDGFFYVPSTYDANVATPLIVLLHGAGQDDSEWDTQALADEADALGFIAMVPSSRNGTWDLPLTGRFGADVQFINSALEVVFDKCNVDATAIGMGGFSDGASYALSLGASNGDLFTQLLGFSPGFWFPAATTGRPPVFITHGTTDPVLPIGSSRDNIVPNMREAGYDVVYTEFAGGHVLPLELFQDAMQWFVDGGPVPLT
jgi:phospholipase/carboxylesterase